MLKQYLVTALVMLLVSASAWHRAKEKKRLMEAEAAKVAFEMKEPTNERPAELDNLPPRRRHKHHVIVNSNQSKHVYMFPQILKNVESIELINAIVPRGQLRINEYNNVLPMVINGTEYILEIPMGDYINILYFLIEINYQLKQILPAGQYIIFLYDLMKTKVKIMVSAGVTLEMPFGLHSNTVEKGLGFDKDQNVSVTEPLTTEAIGSTGYVRDIGSYAACITYLNDRLLTDNIINSLPTTFYTSADLFPLDGDGNPDLTVATWNAVVAPNRANLSFQLYIDVSVDEVSYWDGSRQMARIFISDDQEQVEYRAKETDVHRKMREEMKDFDRLTINLDSISGSEIHPYKLNGLPYSLQFEIITLDN